MEHKSIIPVDSKVYKTLVEVAKNTRTIIFSGLPGVGKSLYVNEFYRIANELGKQVDVIQWDVARKAFETEEIAKYYPTGNGVVHNGLKIIAGKWLMDRLLDWKREFELDNNRLILIEAPLVGHRLIELIKPCPVNELEDWLSSEHTKVVMPIPSKNVRRKIEESRSKQVSEDAKTWLGAKPSVMLMLWKKTCEIANEFGTNVDLSGQPDYDDKIYEFVFSTILKHRQFVPLRVDEVFEMPEGGEEELHSLPSLIADQETADYYGRIVRNLYPSTDEIDQLVETWYQT